MIKILASGRSGHGNPSLLAETLLCSGETPAESTHVAPSKGDMLNNLWKIRSPHGYPPLLILGQLVQEMIDGSGIDLTEHYLSQ